MHIRLLAVGDRQPGWVDDAFNGYTSRFPREWRFRLDTIATARRAKNESTMRAIDAEGEALLAKLGPDEQLVLLESPASPDGILDQLISVIGPMAAQTLREGRTRRRVGWETLLVTYVNRRVNLDLECLEPPVAETSGFHIGAFEKPLQIDEWRRLMSNHCG